MVARLCAELGVPHATLNVTVADGNVQAEARAAHPDFRFTDGDLAYMGDPPHEPQGWYGNFDSDTAMLDVIRAHALGNFRELVRASAVSPAMLWYLDGRVNRRVKPDDKPNENYARELLELHTLGVHGGYTQQDVQELARMLTGWSIDGRGGGRPRGARRDGGRGRGRGGA